MVSTGGMGFEGNSGQQVTQTFGFYLPDIFHKLSTIHECQYYQLRVIRNHLNQWSLQPWNIIILSTGIQFHIYLVQIKKETWNTWEHKIGNIACKKL